MKYMNSYSICTNRQSGFTLIELLVVVSILAAMAGIGVGAYDRYMDQARVDLADTEMTRISNAILKFSADTGYFPGEGPFAQNETADVDKMDFSFLFYSPLHEGSADGTQGKEIMPWNADNERGWSGPYLTFGSVDYMRTEGCGSKAHDDKMQVFPVNTTRRDQANGIIALEDPFETPVRRRQDSTSCFVYRDGTGAEGVLWREQQNAGSPYRYDVSFKNDHYLECPEAGKGCIALLSAGKNGRFENGGADDVVVILRAKS